MTDTLGWRATFGVVTPSPNRVVQPEYDGMRPVGVTNHLARMAFSVPPVANDGEFRHLVHLIDQALEPAIDRVMTATPSHLIIGVSVEAVWNGLAGAQALRERVRARSGIDCTTAAEAVPAALQAVGAGSRIAVISPYTQSGNDAVVRFFAECGIEVVRILTIVRDGPPKRFSEITPDEIRRTLIAVDGPDASAIVQFGANVPMAALVPGAEFWLAKPVIAVNTATYWHALRSRGIMDKVPGWGQLLERY
jgi:maleate isomerase